MVKGVSLSLVLSCLILLLASTSPLVSGEAFWDNVNQTWPTRTPTPESVPTRQPDPDEPAPGSPNPSQPDASQTPTSSETQPAEVPNIVPTTTPNDFYLIPTAIPCGIPPTVLALGSVSVRTGPAIDYPLMGSLAYSDVRIIIGRSEFTPWWLVQFDEIQQGWVSDSAVMVHGYTGNTPLVTLSAERGNTGSENDKWNPTPLPQCTPEFTDNSSQPVSALAVETPVPSATASQQALSSTVISEAVVNADPSDAIIAAEQTEIQIVPGDVSERSSTPLSWLPVMGLLLILVGAALLLFQHWQTKEERD